VVLVELGLQLIAAGEQFTVAWGHVTDDVPETIPETLGIHTHPWQNGLGEEVAEDFRHLHSTDGHAFGLVSGVNLLMVHAKLLRSKRSGVCGHLSGEALAVPQGGTGDVTRLSDSHHLANGFANFTLTL